MRMTKVRALCLSGALFTVLPCAQGSEKDELALVMKQLDQLQASLERAKVVAVQEHTSHRFYFDYPQEQRRPRSKLVGSWSAGRNTPGNSH